ncbi:MULTISPECIES: phosphatase PAP2 family protein [Cupriavidus]|uniref:phosphatase PAP2 family protein n=1 Tax=Cupriavidus sp. WS TaxID=1312922 RepID=UPI00037ED0CB|nr:phosphatase PAP2 family protein [Cupriavidus sp. WS]
MEAVRGADAWLTPLAALGAVGLLAVFVLLLLGVVRGLLLVIRPLVRRLDGARLRGRDALLARAGPPWPRLLRVLERVLERDVAELLLLATAGALLLACAAALLWLGAAIAHGAPLVRLDEAVFAQLRAWRRDWLDVAMVAITELGGARVSVAVALAVLAWLAWRRAWVAAAYWVGALLGARACVMVLKLALARGRPASIYDGLESFSFPSGHAASSMVTYGFLAFLLCLRQPWRVRMPVVALTAVAVALICLSRLYLGMHWLSDVLAGCALGFAWIVLLGTAYAALHAPERLAPLRLGALAAAAALAAGAWILVFRLDETVERYRRALTAGTAPAAAASTPAAGRSCDGRCPALRSGSPPPR